MASLYWRPPATAPAPQTTWAVSWVITACTPGKLEASLVSIHRMRAWGWGLRSTRAYNIPGNLISLVYLACPVTRAIASTRGVTWPMVIKGWTAALTPHPRVGRRQRPLPRRWHDSSSSDRDYRPRLVAPRSE